MTRFREYVIKDGDTLQMIAQRTLGDASRGMELAVLNNLKYPFIVGLGEEIQEGVKTIGDTILIPAEVEHDVPVDEIKDDIYALAFGSDLLLTTDKTNLSFNHGGELVTDIYGDLQTVSGIKCLYQDLVHRLITDVGTLPYHPDYGSRFMQIVGNKKDSTWKQKAVIEVARTFRSDPRVVDVKNIDVEDVPTGIKVNCIVVTSISEFIFNEIL